LSIAQSCNFRGKSERNPINFEAVSRKNGFFALALLRLREEKPGQNSGLLRLREANPGKISCGEDPEKIN
jgi:hypothetical protein